MEENEEDEAEVLRCPICGSLVAQTIRAGGGKPPVLDSLCCQNEDCCLHEGCKPRFWSLLLFEFYN